MIKRVGYLLSSAIVSLSALFVLAPTIVNAAADTCTWTGAANSDMSNSGNWTGCDNGATPEVGDSLIFPYGAGVTNKTINNDFSNGNGTSFASITFSGTAASSESDYTISGNSIALTSGITHSVSDGGYSIRIDIDITASSNLVFNVGNSGFQIGSYEDERTLALGTNGLTVTGSGFLSMYSSVTGSGAISSSAPTSFYNDNSSYSGTFTTTTSTTLGHDGFGGKIVLTDNANLAMSICDGAQSNLDLDINGGTYDEETPKMSIYTAYCESGDGGGMGGSGCDDDTSLWPCDFVPDDAYYASSLPTEGSATLTGSINLGSNVSLFSNMKDLKITSELTGSKKLSLLPGGNAQLNLASTNNDSATPNGKYSPTRKVTKVTNAGASANHKFTASGYLNLVMNGKRGVGYVYDGAMISGTGTTGKLTIDKDSFIAPGLSPGCLSTAGLVEKGTYIAEIGGTKACSGYDQIKVTGTVNVTGGKISPTLYNNYKPGIGQKYTVIQNDGSDKVVGTFKGLSEAETFVADGYVFRISYVGGDGNDVVISVVSVAGAPDTGFMFIKNNPIITLAGTAAIAGALVLMSRKLKLATKKVRR